MSVQNGPNGAGAAGPLSGENTDVAARLLRSVVLVHSRGGSGSGTIWRANGLIVTNHHVVRGDEARITLATGRELPARVTAREPRRDLAALQVDARDLPAVLSGDSARTHVGQWVLAAGNPLGMRGVVTAGIITGVGQVAGPDRTWLDDMIQADVTLEPGNSGGPLADAAGRVLGINSMIMSSGLALAIPTHAVEAFLAPVAPHAYLGIAGVDVAVRARGASRTAVLVVTVEPGSPADRAGLVQGDVVLALDGRAVGSGEELRGTLRERGAEGALEIEALRGGAPRRFTAVPALRAAA